VGRLVTELVLRGLDRRYEERAALLATLLDEDAAARGLKERAA
jgi:hypothetical protein